MRNFSRILLLSLICLVLASPTYAQFTTFVVDDDGNPATTYPDLASAIATATAFAGGPHEIVVMPGSYSDANLSPNPAKIGRIYGDPLSDVSDIVFTAPLSTDDFISPTGAMTIEHLTLTGYNYGVDLSAASGATVQDMFFDGNARGVQGGSTASGNTVQGNTFINHSDYAAAFGSGTSGNVISDNCFIDNNPGFAQALDNDGNTWSDNYWNDYDGSGSYALDGSGANSDASPWVFSIVPSASSPQEFGTTFVVTFDIDVPGCSDLDSVLVGGYEFTVTTNAAKLNFVSGDYDEGYLGNTGDGALYTSISSTAGSATYAATNFTTPGSGAGTVATGEFEVIAANTSVNINVSATLVDENGDEFASGGGSVNVVLEDNSAPVMDPIVANNPVGDDTYSDGSTAGPGPFVLMYLQFAASDNFDLDKLQWSVDNTTWTDYGPFTGLSGTSYTNAPDSQYLNIGSLYPTEGMHTFYVRAIDAAGNISNVEGYTFYIDRTGPVLDSITLADSDGCADDGYTSSQTLDVVLFDDGTATEMEFYVAGWEGPIAYANPTTYDLPAAEATYTVYNRQYDAYGNRGNQESDVIILDTTAPPTTQDFALGVGAKTSLDTIDADVTTFSAPYYLWSEDAGDLVCTATWLAPPTHPFDVVLSAGDGMKYVYFTTRDEAGNLSPVQVDSVEKDQTAPTITSVVVTDPAGDGAGGEDCTDTWLVDVTVEWSDMDVDFFRIDNGGAYTQFNAPGLYTSPQTFSYTMTGSPTSDQDITINVTAFDNSSPRNSSTDSDDIYLDYSDPSIAALDVLDVAATDAPNHPAYSNDLNIDLELTTASADVVELIVSEDAFTTADTFSVTAPLADPTLFNYDYQGTPTECGNTTLYVMGMDCAGNKSAMLSHNIRFDFTDPVVDSVTGPALTNNTLVNLNLFASDNCALYQMRLSEDPSFSGATWMAYSATPSFTLSSGDGTKTVYVQVADRGGNMSAAGSVDIELDATAPTGTFAVVSTNPMAVAGWTDVRDVTIESISADADVVDMAIRNDNDDATGSSPTGWIALASSFSPWQLISGGYGTKGVEVKFRDGAGNQSPWILVNIEHNGVAPPPPPSAWASPTGSAEIEWDAVANVQKYLIRYNFTNDYPAYPNDTAPHPLTFAEGILMTDSVTGTMYTFEGPQPDIYSVSIWSLGNNGVWSASPNTDVYTTNYILGDFATDDQTTEPDGCIDFALEFGALAASYNTVAADAEYNEYLDLAPTSDGSPMGYPIPDMAIDFDDLVIFALNYRDYRCSQFQTDDNGKWGEYIPKPSIAPVAVTVEMPNSVRTGDEVRVPVLLSDAQDVMGYHFQLDFDRSKLELVSVEKGAVYGSVEKSFFYYEDASEYIDIASVVLGDENIENGEVAVMTFRATSSGTVSIEDRELDVRDWGNNRPDVAFNVALSGAGLPTDYAVSQNYPNPFNPTTSIELSLPTASEYTLTIYNIAGQVVNEITGRAEAGYHTIVWDASGQASGIYLYRVQAGSFSETRKMVLLK